MYKNLSWFTIESSIFEFGRCSLNLWQSTSLSRLTCVLLPRLSQPRILTTILSTSLTTPSRNILRTTVSSRMPTSCPFGIWRNLCLRARCLLFGKGSRRWPTWLLVQWRRRWMQTSASTASKYSVWTSLSTANSRSGWSRSTKTRVSNVPAPCLANSFPACSMMLSNSPSTRSSNAGPRRRPIRWRGMLTGRTCGRV